MERAARPRREQDRHSPRGAPGGGQQRDAHPRLEGPEVAQEVVVGRAVRGDRVDERVRARSASQTPITSCVSQASGALGASCCSLRRRPRHCRSFRRSAAVIVADPGPGAIGPLAYWARCPGRPPACATLPPPAADAQHSGLDVLAVRALEDGPGLPALSAPAGAWSAPATSRGGPAEPRHDAGRGARRAVLCLAGGGSGDRPRGPEG